MKFSLRFLSIILSSALLISQSAFADSRCIKPIDTLKFGKSKFLGKLATNDIILNGDGTKIILSNKLIGVLTGTEPSAGYYLYDRTSGSSELISVLPDGLPMTLSKYLNPSFPEHISMSDDSRYVAMGDLSLETRAIYLRDRNLQQTIKIADDGTLDRISGNGKLVSYLVPGLEASADFYDIATQTTSTNLIPGLNTGGAPVTFGIARDGGSFYTYFKYLFAYIGSEILRSEVNNQAVYSVGEKIEGFPSGAMRLLPLSSSGFIVRKRTGGGISKIVINQNNIESNSLFFSKHNVDAVANSTNGDIVLVHGRSTNYSKNGVFKNRYFAIDIPNREARCFSLPPNAGVFGEAVSGDGSVIAFFILDKSGNYTLRFFS